MNIRKSSFEEELMMDGSIIYTNVGNSMRPIIREGRDVLVILPKPAGRLKKYDIPLYRRSSGQYVLHRIIKVQEDGYVLCGDNRYYKEANVQDEQVIGVLAAIIRGKHMIRVTDTLYRIYVHLWCDLFWIRAVMLRIRDRIRKVRKYCKKVFSG